RHQRRRAGDAAHRAVDHAQLRLDVGVRRDGRARALVADGLAAPVRRAGQPSEGGAGRARDDPERSSRYYDQDSMAVAHDLSAGVGGRGRQVRDRSDPVALPLLDSGLPAPPLRHRSAVDGAAPDRHLPDRRRRQHRRRMAVLVAAEAGMDREPRPQDRDADLHARLRYVPAAGGRIGDWLCRHGGRRRRDADCQDHRLRAAGDRQLRAGVPDRGVRVPGDATRRTSDRAAPRAGHAAARAVTTAAPAAAGLSALAPAELRQIVRDALRTILPGSRVLAVISDRTRDDNTDLLFPMISQELAAVGAASLDALVAQGTHPAMSDADKRAKIGAGLAELPLLGTVFDHHWDKPSELVTLGSLSR